MKFHTEIDRRTRKVFRFRPESDKKILRRLEKYLKVLRGGEICQRNEKELAATTKRA